jgi:multiple sugar transport system permease protein
VAERDLDVSSVRAVRARRQAAAGWLFSLPFLLVFATFTAGPVLAALAMSLTDIRSSDVRSPLAVEVVGLANYAELVTDARFGRALFNTLVFVGMGVPLTVVAALAVAVGLNRVTRLRGLFRVGYYLPVVTSIVAVAVVWRFLLQPDSGLVNQLLALVGGSGPDWLESTTFALPALVVMTAWRGLGTLMVVFLAALQAVPQHLLEAAEVDGASAWQRFRHVTLPALRPVLLFGAVVTSVGQLQLFEEPFVMTQGGPLDSTLSISYYVYNQFGFGAYGYASAVGYVLFVLVVAVTAVQFRLLGERG